MTSIYPVGHVYTSVVSTNPATLLAGMSGTTWVAFGSGKTLVGLDSGDGDFNSPEETGGAKTDNTTSGSTAITVAQMPSHTHSFTYANRGDAWGGSYAMSVSTGGYTKTTTSQGSNAGHTHTNNHSIVQPYIVVYFWKRTA